MLFVLILGINYSSNANEEKSAFEVTENIVKHKEKIEDGYQPPTPEEVYYSKESEDYRKLYFRISRKYPDLSKDQILAKMQEVWNRKKYIDSLPTKKPKKTLNNEEDAK